MKEVDPAIKIHGMDAAYYIHSAYESLFGGEHDITGSVPGKNYYYCDGLSWHRYPLPIAALALGSRSET